jgi:DNA replication and repair protein RecF
MAIQSVSLQNFRNISSATLELSESINYFVGKNGSGKTSVLEAVYYLQLGRSFRTHLPSRIVKDQQQEFLLFSSTLDKNGNEIKTGLKRCLNGEFTAKRNGNPLVSLSELAQVQPIQFLSPESFELINGGPGNRRKFLDWGLFHVEQSFFNIWKRYSRSLKHRNSMLRKQQLDMRELKYWDKELVALGEEITQQRKQYCGQISGKIKALFAELLPMYQIDLNYYQGWEKGALLYEKLLSLHERDKQLGYTNIGPHKADLKISIDGKPVSQVLSRGQQKLLVFVLCVAQSVLLFEQTRKRCVFLIDDISSELDSENRAKLFKQLQGIGSQLLITLINIDDLPAENEEFNGKVFHVEHGNIITKRQ